MHSIQHRKTGNVSAHNPRWRVWASEAALPSRDFIRRVRDGTRQRQDAIALTLSPQWLSRENIDLDIEMT
jgi:hypothetical protein